ncbi:MAG: inositol monophosphatase family protein [Solirubrobacterales bacterium]
MGASVVHAPRLRRTYSALRGAGAWCNDSLLPLRPCPEKSLDACLVATGFSPDQGRREVQGAQLVRLLPCIRDTRCRGAASLELCAVAAGEADAYYESDLHLWDVAAGSLVASEAGVSVLGAEPPGAHPLVAARGRVAGELAEALAQEKRG